MISLRESQHGSCGTPKAVEEEESDPRARATRLGDARTLEMKFTPLRSKVCASKKAVLMAFAILGVLTGFSYGADSSETIGPFGTLNNSDNPLVIDKSKAQAALNVDVTQGGMSVKKRKGYGQAFALTYTTSPVHGVYDFYDSNGNSVDLFFNDRYLTSSVGGSAATVLFSTGTNGATWQCTDSQGYAYCASSARDPIIKTDGVTAVPLDGAPAGTMITATPERLAIAGVSGYPNRLYLSKANDFTSWTPGAEVTDPDYEEIVGPGSRLAHIVYACNEILWFKDASSGYILGSDNSNWEIIMGSPNIGTLDNTSVVYPGGLQFRAQDGHIHDFNCASLTKLTDEIQTTINAAATRRPNLWTQTSQSDFEGGASSPTFGVDMIMTEGSVTISSYGVSFQDGFIMNGGMERYYAGAYGTMISSWVGTAYYGGLYQKASYDGNNCDAITSHSGSYFGGIQYPTAGTVQYIRAQVVDALDNSIVYSTLTLPSPTSCDWTYYESTITASGQGKYCQFRFQLVGYSGSSSTTTFTNNGVFKSSYTVGFYYSADYDASGYWMLVDDVIGQWVSQTATSTVNSSYYAKGEQPALGIDGIADLFILQSATDSTTGPWTDLTTSSNTTGISHAPYLRVISNFSDPSVSGSSVAIVARSSGTYVSNVHNAPLLESWDNFAVTKQDNGGSHTFYVRSSTDPFIVLSSTPSWVAQTAGATVACSTGTYFQMRDDFAITAATQTPTLNDFTFNWYEGNASDKAYGIYYSKDNCIWWAVASGTGVATNNYILRNDLLNAGWTLYDIAVNGMLIRDGDLYFGSASGGYIYKYGDSYLDNGSYFTSYWKSKDFVVGGPFNEKEFRTISIVLKNIAYGTIFVDYEIDGAELSYYDVPTYPDLSVTVSDYVYNNRMLPAGTVGMSLNLQINDYGLYHGDEPWEVFGMQFTYSPKPWKAGHR